MSKSPLPSWILPVVVCGTLTLALFAWRFGRPYWARLHPGPTLVLTIDSAHPFDAGVTPDQARQRTLEILRHRIEVVSPLSLVATNGDRIEVVLPRGEKPEAVERILTRTGRLEFKLVDDGSNYMAQIAALVAAERQDGVEIGHDGWAEKDSAAPHTDLYLGAPKPAALKRAWIALMQKLPLPPDHEVAFEEHPPQGEHSWRSYYLYRRAELNGDFIRDAEVQWDQQSGRPEVSLTFDPDGAKKLETLTEGAVGRKLAIMLEGRVSSAPVIEGKIGGGHARITLGGVKDPYQLEQDAKDLVAVLRTGSSAAPVTLVETRPPR